MNIRAGFYLTQWQYQPWGKSLIHDKPSGKNVVRFIGMSAFDHLDASFGFDFLDDDFGVGTMIGKARPDVYFGWFFVHGLVP